MVRRARISPKWLSAAIAASALLVLAAPFIAQLMSLLRDVAQARYATVLAVAVAGAGAVAFTAAVLTIADRRRSRYGWLAAALLLAVSYAAISRTGVADVDAAERVHFIEYGFIALLFYLAARPLGDGAVVAMPLLSAVIVGTVEEWLQWFVPARVGEVRDVLLNLVAAACGVLFGFGVAPPPRVSFTLAPGSRRLVGVLAAVAVTAFAAFFQSVHLGYEIADHDAGIFRSRYEGAELLEISAQRAAEWRDDPPLAWSRLSREDQYLSEGIAHVRRRNERWSEGNLLAARHENLILEKYYAPVLDTPSYAAPEPHRWPAEQRAEAEGISGSPGFMIYDSDALPYPVFTWSKWVYWSGVALLVALVLRVCRAPHTV